MALSLKKVAEIFKNCGYICKDFNDSTLSVSKERCLKIMFYEEPLAQSGWMFQVGEEFTPSILDAIKISEGEIK